MKFKKLVGPVLGLVAGLSLAACGGGSSSGAGPNPNLPPAAPPPAASTPVTVVGTITGFGSVFVNGTRYEVAADTVIAIEGESESMGDDSRLLLGMKVEVEADDNNGQRTARRIEFDDDLKGPIGSLMPDATDPTIGTFSVIGYTVTVDSNTIFDDDIGNATEWCSRLLQEQGVALVPGAAFGDDTWVRMSYATSDDLIEQGLVRIASMATVASPG